MTAPFFVPAMPWRNGLDRALPRQSLLDLAERNGT